MSRRQSSSHQQQPQQPHNRRVCFEDAFNSKPSKLRLVGLTGSRGGSKTPSSSTNNNNNRTATIIGSTTAIDPSSASIPLNYSSNNYNHHHPASIQSTIRTANTPQSILKKKKHVTVLHGRVMKQQHDQEQKSVDDSSIGDDDDDDDDNNKNVNNNNSKQQRSFFVKRGSNSNSNSNVADATNTTTPMIIHRTMLERKAVYTQLVQEMKQLEQQVITLESTIKKENIHLNSMHLPTTTALVSATNEEEDEFKSSSPSSRQEGIENQWRIRLLLKKAQDADTIVWKKLYEYETTLHHYHQHQHQNQHNQNNSITTGTTGSSTKSIELQDLQTSCMKLHRDFNRCHKVLLMCMSLIGDSNANTNGISDDMNRSSSSTNYTNQINNNAVTTPIVESVGWSNMMLGTNTTTTGSSTINSISSNHIVKEIAPKPICNSNYIENNNNNNTYNDDDDGSESNGILSPKLRSSSPISAVYTTIRQEQKMLNQRNQSKARVVDTDDMIQHSRCCIDHKSDDGGGGGGGGGGGDNYCYSDTDITEQQYDIAPEDDWYEKFTTTTGLEESKFCDSPYGMFVTCHRNNNDSSHNVDPFWICSILDWNSNVNPTTTGTVTSTTNNKNDNKNKYRISNRHVIETDGKNNNCNHSVGGEEAYDGNATTTTTTGSDDVNDDSKVQYSNPSSNYYDKWYQQLQDSMESIRIDLLHFRSRSLNNTNARSLNNTNVKGVVGPSSGEIGRDGNRGCRDIGMKCTDSHTKVPTRPSYRRSDDSSTGNSSGSGSGSGNSRSWDAPLDER